MNQKAQEALDAAELLAIKALEGQLELSDGKLVQGAAEKILAVRAKATTGSAGVSITLNLGETTKDLRAVQELMQDGVEVLQIEEVAG